EGYHGAGAESTVRVELCEEALRLVGVLLEHPVAATPATLALAALLHLHGARLPSRLSASGDLHAFADQDRSQWDQALIARGQSLLERSAAGDAVTEYHLEAAIAWLHATTRRPEDTDWQEIVRIYDALLAVHPSPVIAL